MEEKGEYIGRIYKKMKIICLFL